MDEEEWLPPQTLTIGPLCWQLGEDGRYTFIDGAIGGRYQCGVSESLLVKRLAAAQQDLAELRKFWVSDDEVDAMKWAIDKAAWWVNETGECGDELVRQRFATLRSVIDRIS